MAVDNIIVCPSCNKEASWSMYFQRYVCPYCGWEGNEGSNKLEVVEKKKINIDYVYCSSPKDISYWISGFAKNDIGIDGFNYWNSAWDELKDGSQIISVSYDQNYDMYLVVFRVEEE